MNSTGVPDLPGADQGRAAEARAAKPTPPPAARAAYARRSLTVLFPMLLVFMYFSLTSDAVILVYAALLSLLPSFAAGWKQGKAMITANLIEQFLIHLLVIIQRDLRPIAPVIKSAFNAVVLLVGMSVTITGADAASKFYTRIAQIIMAVVYVAVAFGFLEYLQRKRVKA